MTFIDIMEEFNEPAEFQKWPFVWKKRNSEDLLAKLRETFPDICVTTLKSFLIAHLLSDELPLKTMPKLLRGVQSWRREMQWDILMERNDFPEEFYTAAHIYMVDRQSHPVLYFKFSADLQKLSQCIRENMKLYEMYIARLYQRLRLLEIEISALHGRPDSMWHSLCVLDMTELGLSWAIKYKDILKTTLSSCNGKYGEMHNKVLLVNPSVGVRFLLGIIAPFVSKSAMAKTKQIKQKKLKSYILPKYIPKFLGGECEVEPRAGYTILPDSFGIEARKI